MVLLLLKTLQLHNDKYVNLHSNMVLLLQIYYKDVKAINPYLHSNMVLLLRGYSMFTFKQKRYLHSNMVLLLLSFSFNTPIGVPLFTFQYGATSTKILIEILITILKFTFQYGATSTT